MTADFHPMRDEDTDAVIDLWQRCDLTRPWNPPDKDITEMRTHPTAEILVARHGEHIRASVAVGYDGHRGWVYYVATDPDHRCDGLGRTAMQAAESWLKQRNVPKIQLMVRESNATVIGFYAAQGYQDSGVRVLQKWLSGERAQAYEEGADGH